MFFPNLVTTAPFTGQGSSLFRRLTGAGLSAFAAAFLHGMHAQWPIDRTAHMANALGALIASRPGATPPWQLEECLRLIARSGNAPTSAAEDNKHWEVS